MVARWARWRALPARERRETWLAAGLIPIAAASLRVVGAPRTLRSLARRPRGAKAGDVQAAARAAARAVARAARHAPYRGNCLSQSIALMWLLGRRGIAADLRFGARRREGRLEAHAWVEHEGMALNEARDVGRRFAPLVPPVTDRVARRSSRPATSGCPPSPGPLGGPDTTGT